MYTRVAQMSDAGDVHEHMSDFLLNLITHKKTETKG